MKPKKKYYCCSGSETICSTTLCLSPFQTEQVEPLVLAWWEGWSLVPTVLHILINLLNKVVCHVQTFNPHTLKLFLYVHTLWDMTPCLKDSNSRRHSITPHNTLNFSSWLSAPHTFSDYFQKKVNRREKHKYEEKD